MSPPYLFRIDEVEEHPDAPSHVDNRGNWVPCTDPRTNVRVPGGVSGCYYYCDGQRIYRVANLPSGARPYKTFSMYFCGGYGFWVLNGDATDPPDDQTWQPLRFDHSPHDYSSFLTNAGEQTILRVQRRDQQWPRLLLPDIYHTPVLTDHQQYGGLRGELPIFLGLIAFSTSREYLPFILPNVFVRGAWAVHGHGVPRTNQRGVVVTVYTCPSAYAGGSTAYDLSQYEQGNLGNYFN